MKMGRQDIETVYCLNATEYDAFQMYFAGNTVPQISEALNMTNTSAGKVLDSARNHVWDTMTEKRVNRGEMPSGLSVENHGSTQEPQETNKT
jgi:hypothetical protein